MAWWGWIVMILVCSLCILLSVWVLSRKNRTPAQVDKKALDDEASKALQQQLEAETEARKQAEAERNALAHKLKQSQAEHQQALEQLKKELADEETRLATDPDHLNTVLGQLLNTSEPTK